MTQGFAVIFNIKTGSRKGMYISQNDIMRKKESK